METNKNRRSIVTNHFVASLLFLLIGLRFNAQGDQIGTVIYAAATIIVLMRAGLLVWKNKQRELF